MSIEDMKKDSVNDLTLFSQDESARQINRLHALANGHAEMAIQKAIQCGGKLAEKKASLAHGEWIPWIENNLTFSDRQASTYMRVATNRKRVSDLDSIREAVKLLAEPREDTLDSTPAEFHNDPELEKRASDAERRSGQLERALNDLDREVKAARGELDELRKLKADKAKVEKALLDLHELEKKKQELFKDAESTKLVHEVLVRSREFFTRECMQIPALKLRPESIRVMQQDFEGLVELVENWLTAIRDRFITE